MSRTDARGPNLPAPRADVAQTWTALREQLHQVLESGHSTPCQVDPEPFTSERPEHRREAAAACTTCAVLVECGRYALAAGERAHVWGGVDLTPRRGPHTPQRALAQLLDDEPTEETR